MEYTESMMRNVLLCTMQRFMPPSNPVTQPPQTRADNELHKTTLEELCPFPAIIMPKQAILMAGLSDLSLATSLGSLFPTSLPAIGSEAPAERVGLRRNEHISELVYAGIACLGGAEVHLSLPYEGRSLYRDYGNI